jgi:hypothetical protein
VRATIDGTTYTIDFTHEERATICIVFVEDGVSMEKIFSGSSVLHLGDTFCKRTGRRLSLTRALKSFPRELRRKLWQAYLSRTPRRLP